MKLLALALCIAAAAAAPAAPLGNGTNCAPDQWESIIMATTGYSGKKTDGSIDSATWFAYDYTNQREASYVNSTGDDGKVHLTVELKLYKKGIHLTAHRKNRTCIVTGLPKHMPRRCLTKGAQIIGQWMSGSNTISGVKFNMTIPEGNVQVTNFADMKTGLPVSQTIAGVSKNGYSYFLAQMFLNSSMGIENEDTMFKIPHYCSQPIIDFGVTRMCGPREYETTILSQTGYTHDSGVTGVVDGSTWMAYDFKNKREALYTNSSDSVNGDYMTITIMDYKKMMQYVAKPASSTCTVTKLTTPMISPCPGANATFHGVYQSGTDNVAVIKMPYMGGDSMTYGDTKTHMPISQLLQGRNEAMKSNYITAQLFVDSHKGIRDASVFTPPPYCNKAPVDPSSVVG